MPPPGGVDDLNMDRDVIPLDGYSLELRRGRRELHPCPDRHWGAIRSRWLSGQVHFDGRKPNRSGDAGNLLRARRHLLIDAIRIAAIGAHLVRVEQTFDSADQPPLLCRSCGKSLPHDQEEPGAPPWVGVVSGSLAPSTESPHCLTD